MFGVSARMYTLFQSVPVEGFTPQPHKPYRAGPKAAEPAPNYKDEHGDVLICANHSKQALALA